MKIEKPTKSNVDTVYENSTKRRDLSSVFNDQDNKFDCKKLTKLDSSTVIRILNSDNKVSNKI